MRLDGTHVITSSRQQVWEALQDPAVLAATIPGCRELRLVAEDTYAAQVEAGIASLTGVYEGQVAIRDRSAPERYVLAVSGQGGPGTIDATVTVSLSETDEGTTAVSYDAEAVIGGRIAGVGQRVVAGVARRSAAEFFTAVDHHLAGELPTAVAPAAPAPGAVYRAPQREARAADPRALLLAAAAGAAIALLGVLVGRHAMPSGAPPPAVLGETT